MSSLLAASARNFGGGASDSIQSHANVVLERALSSGKVDVGIVQSLMLASYYKVSSYC